MSLALLWSLFCLPAGAVAQQVTINMSLVGQWDEYNGSYGDVWAEGDYAYLPNFGSDPNGGRVHIIDISDPTTPTLASTFLVPFPNAFASPQDVKVANGLLFVSSSGGGGSDSVVIADVRDPTTPTQIAAVAIPGFISVHNLFYADGYLYLANSQTSQVAIVDLTNFDPDNPPASRITTARWILPVVGGSFVHDITVTNGRLYAAAWNSLHIYDIANIANALPNELGTAPGNALHSMWPTASATYVVTGEERFGGGITVFRMTPNGNLLDLTVRDTLSLSGNISSVHNQIIIGNRLYNSWYQAGVRIDDINPATGKLEFVGSYDTSDCWGVYPWLGDDRILLSDIQDGLIIVAIGGGDDDGEVPVFAPRPAIAPHDIPKNRFISFRPNLTLIDTAISVEMLDLACSTTGKACSFDADCKVCDTGDATGNPCVTSGTCPGGTCVLSGESCDEQSPPIPLGWVGAPFVPNTDRTPPGTHTALVVDRSAIRRWTEPVIHLGDCEIAPARTYGLRTTQDELNFSDPLIVGTIAQPEGKFWADLVGSFDGTTWSAPNLLVNVDDVSAMLKFLFLLPAPHITVVDLASEQPNFIVNATDLLLVIQGFKGGPYPPLPFPNQGDPSQCP